MFTRLPKNRKPNRLKDYDYSQGGYYFVTISIKNGIEFFGKIINGKMELNQYGEIIKKQWLWLSKQYDYVKLDGFVVMPNHLHGILAIENDMSIIYDCRDNPRVVPTSVVSTGIYNRRYNPLSKTINAFKTTSSKLIHQNGLFQFSWQRSFYDHIIRNEKSLQKIRQYIANNPLKWEFDRNNPEGVFM